MTNLFKQKSLLKNLATASLLLCLHGSILAQTVETDTVCSDAFGGFAVASKFAQEGQVSKQLFDQSCNKILLTEFRIDPEHPHLLAAGRNLYGVFKVNYDSKTKYAIVKIR
jgi:hypothetical protein